MLTRESERRGNWQQQSLSGVQWCQHTVTMGWAGDSHGSRTKINAKAGIPCVIITSCVASELLHDSCRAQHARPRRPCKESVAGRCLLLRSLRCRRGPSHSLLGTLIIASAACGRAAVLQAASQATCALFPRPHTLPDCNCPPPLHSRHPVMQTHRRRRPGSVISRAIAGRTLPATQNTAVQGTPRSVQQFGVCLVRIIAGSKLAQERPQCPSIVPCFTVLHRTCRHAASTHMPCRTSAGRRHPGQQTNFGAR